MRRCVFVFLGLLFLCCGLRARAQAFDLTGPKVDVHVKRGNVTLPIGQVPNLQAGDRLWIHPDFPPSQSAHYILIVTFLRGATNPPPNEWFTKVETWSKQAREEGVFVTVPEEAQQALLFLAPETGGDFSTLRNAVRGRPGTFVRSAQDLQAASWDRMRLNAYLGEVKTTSQTDPKSLKERAEVTARSLGIKVNQDCFDKPQDQQALCLSQHTEGLVMDDANAQARMVQLIGGDAGNLMAELSTTTMAGGGAYSPYVGAIVDTARLLASLHTAHYQYIPALALSAEDTLNLRLNVAPSFRDPKSVVVVALPPVGPAVMPPLRPVNPNDSFCAQAPELVLPAEGAPLVLATQLAYDLVLRVQTKKGAVDLPLAADPAAGGLRLRKTAPHFDEPEVTGVVRGKWGFDNWIGPSYALHSAQPDQWKLAASDESALVVGRDDTVHIEGGSSQCVNKVDFVSASGSNLPVTWKFPKPNTLAATLPLANVTPGPVKVEIHQYGMDKPDTLTLNTYAEAASLDRLSLSAGDAEAVLTGTRLDEVAKASLEGVKWSPGALSRVQDVDHLTMNAEGSTEKLEPGKHYFAQIVLRDGRELKAHVSVDPPRPQITLLSKGSQQDAVDTATPVRLGSLDDLPVDRRLVFFLKSKAPASFLRSEKFEVASVDGSFKTELSFSDGSLMLEDANTAMGVIEPLARFGPSAFGPIQVRAVSAEGVAGDWLPLGTLVRIPGYKELRCPRATSKPCTLSGNNLFLTSAVASTPAFDNATGVPPDFTGMQLMVPHPTDGVLYVKLRDDPATVQIMTLPVTPLSLASKTPAPSEAVPAAAPSSTSEAPVSDQAAPPATPASPTEPATTPP
ncbi:MAG: hypothetical protein WBF42_11920, partial [Terracidiphilus sp.]